MTCPRFFKVQNSSTQVSVCLVKVRLIDRNNWIFAQNFFVKIARDGITFNLLSKFLYLLTTSFHVIFA